MFYVATDIATAAKIEAVAKITRVKSLRNLECGGSSAAFRCESWELEPTQLHAI